jgi:hypothetical protein
MKVLPCNFCKAKGKVFNQGGIDGIPEWEVHCRDTKGLSILVCL